MQRVFRQDVRFKDENGKDFSEWGVRELGELADIRTGSQDLQNKVDDGKYPFFVRSQNVERINSYSYDGEAILIPGEGNIGKIFHYINGRFDFHQRVYKISDFNGVLGKYVYYYLMTSFEREAMKNSVKATVDSLRLPTFKNFEVQVPSLDEQEKIVDFLTSISGIIENEQSRLGLLRRSKKSLLRSMFI
jgi:type I restriction enzyme S subunit